MSMKDHVAAERAEDNLAQLGNWRVFSLASRLTVHSTRLGHLVPDLAAVALLLLLVALFFWRLWAPLPADRLAFPVGDFTDQYYPLRRFVAATLASGQIPFWNPYIFGGQPGLADPQTATLYPPALLNALVWGKRFPLLALELEAVAHIALALVGTYLFTRRGLGLDILPSLLGSILFGFGGYLTGFPLEQITILESSAWLPWLLLAVKEVARSPALARTFMWSATGALFLGLALLAGHPQTALYLLYLSVAYAFLQGWLNRDGKAKTWLPFVLLFTLGVGFATAQLLPTYHFITHSSRQVLDYEFVHGGLAWEELTLLFLPKIVGSTPIYAGIPTLLIVPLGLISRGQRTEKRFWGVVALLTFLLALGGNTFLFDLFYLGLPGVEQVRSQERVLLLWSWSIALLAAWGAAWLLLLIQRGQGLRLRRYAGTLSRFLPVLLLPWLALWFVRALAIAQISIDLTVLESFYSRYSFFFLLFTLTWGLLLWAGRHARLKRDGALFGGFLLALLVWDLFTINRGAHLGERYSETLPPRTEVVDALFAWQSVAPARVQVVGQPLPRSNDGMRWEFPLLSGNDPLQLEITNDYLDDAQPWNHLQALNAGYVVADRPLHEHEPDVFELLADSSEPVTSYLLRVRQPMPYAWLVGQTETFESRDEILDYLEEEVVDLHSLALTEEELALSEGQYSPGEHVRVVSRAAARTIQVSNPASMPNLLIIAEPATQGWQTSLDGEPVRWLRANGINLAIVIPPGEHTVTMRYEPPGWREGVLISVASGVCLLALFGTGVLLNRERGT